MRFIGQRHIIEQLGRYLPFLKDNVNEGENFLLRGPSGFGKTDLAKMMCNYLTDGNYSYELGDSFQIVRDVRVYFIDEIHLCKRLEILYPLMDDKREHVFIFATNFDSLLPEAFVNRCVNFSFIAYTMDELVDIFKLNFKYPLYDEVIRYIAEISNKNPRVMIRTYIKSLNLIISSLGEEFLRHDPLYIIEYINRVHGIQNGLTANTIEYIKNLKNLGGKAALDTIVHTLKLDKQTIQYEIEPVLLEKRILKISSKGRELCL